MAGEAPDLGSSILTGALTGILGALTASVTPRQEPVPVAPSIERPPMVFGLPITTLLLIGIGAFVAIKLLR